MIGKELKELLLEENIKIVDFAKIIGINQKTLSNYSNNVSDPDVKTLRVIKQNYYEKTGKNINLDWLISGQGEMLIHARSSQNDLEKKVEDLTKEVQDIKLRLVK